VAGVIVALIGTRACLAIAGGGVVLVWLLTAGALRRAEALEAEPVHPPDAAGRMAEQPAER
jgi:hypothetical protein